MARLFNLNSIQPGTRMQVHLWIVIALLIVIVGGSFFVVYEQGVRKRASEQNPPIASAPSGSYDPNIAADRVRAAQAISTFAGATGRSVTEYVDCAQVTAKSINAGRLPKYHGADHVSIENVAIIMNIVAGAESANGRTLTPEELARKARPFIEESIPR